MTFLFEPDALHALAQPMLGRPIDEAIDGLVEELRARYPGHINEERPIKWIWSLAGGVTGVMTILHASLSEYLLLFGAPGGSEGFSGRYHIDIHDFVLAGEMWTYREADPTRPVISGPGAHTLLERGAVKGVTLRPGTWLLEYARGPIATCLPMALGDSVFSAMDGTTIFDTFKVYARLTLRELLQGKI